MEPSVTLSICFRFGFQFRAFLSRSLPSRLFLPWFWSVLLLLSVCQNQLDPVQNPLAEGRLLRHLL